MNMKKVTLTLPDDLARRARTVAAARGQSLSRFVSDLLVEKMGQPVVNQSEAVERFFRAPDFPGISGNLPSREELYAERVRDLRIRKRKDGQS
jgi:hypothetical protein